jgi:hypothetical protein
LNDGLGIRHRHYREYGLVRAGPLQDTPKKADPEATERPILAMVLDDMESLDLIKAPVAASGGKRRVVTTATG